MVKPEDDIPLKRRDLRARTTVGSMRRTKRKKTTAPLAERISTKLQTWFFPQNIHQLDEQNPWGRRIAIAVTALLIGGITAAAVYFARPAKNYLDKSKAKRVVAKLDTYLEQDIADLEPSEITDMAKLARQAHSLAEDHPPALAAVGRVALKTRSPDAPFVWERIEKEEILPSDEASLGLGTAYLNAGRVEEAEAIARRLIKSYPKRVDPLELARKISTARGDRVQTLRYLDQIAERQQLSNKLKFQRASLAVESGLLSTRQNNIAIDEIWEVAWGTGRVGLAAVEFLTTREPPSSHHQLRLSYLLKMHPLAEENHQLEALEQEPEWYVGEKEVRIRQAITERSTWPPAKLQPFANRLNTQGRYEDVLLLFQDRDPKTLGPAIQQYSNALLALNRFDELKELIYGHDSGLTSSQRELYAAHFETLQDMEGHDPQRRLRQSFNEAKMAGQPFEIIHFANYALRQGFYETAEQGFREALNFARARVAAERGLIATGQASANTGLAIKALESLVDHNPEIGDLRELTYLRLLRGDNLELCHQQAHDGQRDFPSDPTWALNLGLARHRAGDDDATAEALKPFLTSPHPTAAKQAVFRKLATTCGLLSEANLRKPHGRLFDAELAFLDLDENSETSEWPSTDNLDFGLGDGINTDMSKDLGKPLSPLEGITP